jgi:ferrous iron transport protein A
MNLTLTELRAGDSARLLNIRAQGSFRRRLMEMGLLPGTMVRVVRSSLVSDLVELEVRGMFLSLRREDANTLEVVRS